MKKIFLSAAFAMGIVTLHSQALLAEQHIKVLITGSVSEPQLSGRAESMGTLNGKVLIQDTVYSGLFEVKQDEKGLYFINSLPFETYVAGVIAAEVGRDWADEALKAQAVVSRTYAAYQRARAEGKDYHITSSVFHQAYKGSNVNEAINRAVKETEGEILTYGGKPIIAFYHSTCTGNTELPEEVWGEDVPYVQSVPCEGDYSPYEQWQRRFHVDEIKKALEVKDVKDIRIISHTSTGRARLLRVVTGDSETEVRAVDLRRLLGYRDLPSTKFTVSVQGQEVIFEGEGYGHGVGLSQWGALRLAQAGKGYKEILEHYYPGVVLTKQW